MSKPNSSEKTEADILLEQKQKYVETLKTILRCMIYFLLFAIFMVIFQTNIINAQIPSESMEETISVGDRLIGYKQAYKHTDPERYDIIICYDPMDPNTLIIKRIIGLPGDTLIFENGNVYLNDLEHPLDDSFCKTPESTTQGDLPGNKITIPNNCYFVMGDNRENSFDSRYWTNNQNKPIPFVTRDMIIAKAIFRYYPFNKMGKIQ